MTVFANNPSDLNDYNLLLFGKVLGPSITYASASIPFQVRVVGCSTALIIPKAISH